MAYARFSNSNFIAYNAYNNAHVGKPHKHAEVLEIQFKYFNSVGEIDVVMTSITYGDLRKGYELVIKRLKEWRPDLTDNDVKELHKIFDAFVADINEDYLPKTK